ncbi:MAG: hypothetical protein GY751_01125, partial [Bacteroidetes bacterium]|nr:hypothetical protein [Bacteroidota bacterium]
FVFLLAFYNYIYAGTYNTAILNSPDENTIVLLPFVCDNTTDGGTIEGDETGCPNPIFDPSPILNVEFPSGGSGDLEYLWMFTTDDPTSEVAVWTPISNSNSPNYDPGAITVTTYFVRCARREGCTEYLVETNFVEKKVQCCENVTDGGSIMQNQSSCGEPFNPEVLENLVYPSGGTGDLEFQWYFSNTASPFYTGNPDWVPIIGAVSESYDSGPILQTTYFIRTARRSLCTEYVGVSNMIKIELFTPIFLQIAVNEEINCHGSATGSLNLTITGGTAPFSFSWDPTSIGDTEDPVGLTEGFYSVTVTDVNGCSVSNSITLSEPPGMLLEIQSSDNICFGENDGTASVIVSGGNPPYSYAWSTGASEGGVDGLSAGNYSVVVTDSEGCTESASTTVNGSPDILIETNITNVSCDGNTGGSASVTVSGGTPPYLYSWKDASNSEIGTNSIVNDLLAGSYFIEITDANNCKKTQSVEIITSGQLDLSINKSDALCFGGNGGSASVEAEGGFPPYTYLWDDPSSQTNANAINLKAGLYSVTVSGQNGCTNSISVLINEPPTLGLILNSTVEICEVADNGTANVIAYGGTPDYTFAWNDPLNQVSDSISGLTAGIYTVTVTDANGCTLSDSVEVELAFEPFWLEVYPTNVTCNGENNGSVSVTVIGGQFPPFQYAWNDPEMQTSSVATDLMAGTYIVTVTDLLGCTFPAEAIIYEPPQIGFVPLSEDASCSQNADGKAGIETIWGGTPPYTYLWDDPDAQTDSVATGLAPGTYSLEITDVLGCKANTSIEVFSLEPMVLSPTINHASCDGQTLGSAHINVTGGTPPYTYLWNDQAGQTTSTATALAVGNYSVTVTDANGCQAITPIKIEASGDFSIIIQPSQVVVCGNAVVPFTINANEDILSLSWTASGGTFNDSSSASPTYSMNASGEYIISVSATGINGCSGSAETTVTIHPLAAAGIEVVSGEECDGESFELSATEIDPNYTYHWTATEGILDSPDSSTTLFTGEVPSESTITLEVTNEFGCISSSEITLNTYDTIDINIILQESEICLGEAVLLTSDLVDPAFSYEWTATGGSLDTPNSSSTYFTSSDTGEFVLS